MKCYAENYQNNYVFKIGLDERLIPLIDGNFAILIYHIARSYQTKQIIQVPQ
jgi:hypothetical protein